MDAGRVYLAFARPAPTPRRRRILGSGDIPGQQRSAVAGDHRLIARRGVCRALHTWVEQQARQTPRVCGLRLYVDRHNTRAQQVYGHLGLKPTEYRLYEIDWTAGD